MGSVPRKLAGLPLLLLLGGCGGIFYQPSPRVYTHPESTGYQWQKLSFARPGGGRLSAALVPGRNPDSGRGLIIQFHGNAQNMTAHWMGLQWAVRRGWDLLVWDYSGYGASDDHPSRTQIARDADAFLAWVSDSILPSHPGPVVLIGQSLGAAVLTSAFPRWKDRDRALLVVAEGGFSSYRSIAADVVARQWITWIAWPFVPLLIDEEDAPFKALDRIAPTPFLIISCSDDKIVPRRFQHRMHEQAPGSLLWDVEGCKHIGSFRNDVTRARFQDLVDSLRGKESP